MYSNTFLKGRVGFTGSWPIIVLERARSDKPLTPVRCEVFGWEHESGSCYLQDLELVSLEEWKARVGEKVVDSRYFRGELI